MPLVAHSSGSAPARYHSDVLDIGLPIDARAVESFQGYSTGTHSIFAGQFWGGSDDDGLLSANDGPGHLAGIYNPNSITVGADAAAYTGLFEYESGASNHPPDRPFGNTIRRIDLATRIVTTLAGSPGQSGSVDGQGSAARLSGLVDLQPTTTGLVFVEYGSGGQYLGGAKLRHVSYGGRVRTIAFTGAYTNVDGPGNVASRQGPNGCRVDSVGNVYVCGYPHNNPSAGWVCKVANDPQRTVSTIATGLAFPANIVMFDDAALYVIGFTSGTLWRIDLLNGNAVSVVTNALGTNANGGAAGYGCIYYVLAGPAEPGDQLMQVTVPDGVVSSIAGVPGEHSDPTLHFHGLSDVIFTGGRFLVSQHYGCCIASVLPNAPA